MVLFYKFIIYIFSFTYNFQFLWVSTARHKSAHIHQSAIFFFFSFFFFLRSQWLLTQIFAKSHWTVGTSKNEKTSGRSDASMSYLKFVWLNHRQFLRRAPCSHHSGGLFTFAIVHRWSAWMCKEISINNGNYKIEESIF